MYQAALDQYTLFSWERNSYIFIF